MNSDFSSERAARSHFALTAIAALLISALAYRLAWYAFGPIIGFVVCAPISGAYLAWLLIHRAETWLYFPRWLALRKVHGKRHFFDDRPIRIEEHDGRCRVAAADIFDILGARPGPDTLRRLRVHLGDQGLFPDRKGQWWFDEAAILQWLWRRSLRHGRQAQNLHIWLEREAFPALRRKKQRRVGAASPAPDEPTKA